MSYLTFKIISIIVMIVILIVVVSNKRNQRNIKATNQQDNSDLPETIDYEAIHKEMYYVEYKLIPHFIDMFQSQPEKTSQIILTIYENLVILQNKLKNVNPHFFGSISGEVYGNIENECIVVYQFPKPIDMPLAKYGAIYINKPLKKYSYWTLEYSMNGKYVLGSTTIEKHVNYGNKNNLSKDEFLHEICQIIDVNEVILQSCEMIYRRYVLELNDRNIESTIANHPLLAICFYDYKQPSQKVIPLLEQLAQDYKNKISIGIYDVYNDSNQLDLSKKMSIVACPTILFFMEGKVVDKHIGLCKLEYLKTKFEQILK